MRSSALGSLSLVAALCAATACDSSSPGAIDASPHGGDAGTADAGAHDAGAPDAGPSATGERLLQGGPGIHVVPHVAARADGTTWLSWYAAAADGGDYSIRLQRIDTTGAKLLGPEGVLASAVDSPSYVFDYALVPAANGDAVVAYASTTETVARAQRFDAAGAPAWGASGAVLTAAPEHAYAPHATACSDGAFVVGWDFESGDTSGVAIQRVDAAGHPQWASPARLEGDPGVDAQFVQLAPGDAGDVLVVWRESAFNTPGDAFVQRFDTSGHAVWSADLALNGEAKLPFPEVPVITSDGQGGLYAAWSTVDGLMFRGWVQHVAKDGTTTWAAGGLPVSGDTSMSHLPSAIAANGGHVTVAWKETDADQNFSGLYLQAFDAAGLGVYASSGLPIVPANDSAGGLAAAVRATDAGVALFYAFAPPNAFELRAGVAQVPFAAQPTPALTTLSDVPSAKGHPDASELVEGGYWLVWEDERSGADEIWGTWWDAMSATPD